MFDELWCNRDRLPYPETVGVLEYFKGHGYKMGVISDTYPSLELTLRQLGLDKYFTSFTASSIIGLYKPSPVIFGAALAAQDVTAAESLYVDDCDEEADRRESAWLHRIQPRPQLRKARWLAYKQPGRNY